jgi:hypothetical protein
MISYLKRYTKIWIAGIFRQRLHQRNISFAANLHMLLMNAQRENLVYVPSNIRVKIFNRVSSVVLNHTI